MYWASIKEALPRLIYGDSVTTDLLAQGTGTNLQCFSAQIAEKNTSVSSQFMLGEWKVLQTAWNLKPFSARMYSSIPLGKNQFDP